ncbi:MAG: hypothetical protein ACJ75B_18370 [Flavisolibacter sp.]|jgi:hypothetical protein
MKQQIISLVCAALFSTICMQTKAQKRADYVPEKGFWEIISNKHDKNLVTVQFYNEEKVMMYQETLHSKLNVNRKKIRHQLYDALNEAYQTWTLTHNSPVATNLIAKRR